jgi:16S rRNA (guanine966-N2)-methyltransferase
MRIIAGKHRGKKLAESNHLNDLRPTTDANRENLFNIISSSRIIKNIGFELQNCNLLDVFCGTGAISFEAISRGVKSATLIDYNQKHLEIAKANGRLLKENNLEYFCLDLTKSITKAIKQYNLVFIDPPYAKNFATIAVKNLIDCGWIDQWALIIIEHSIKEDLQPLKTTLTLLEQKKYAKTIFSFFIQTK